MVAFRRCAMVHTPKFGTGEMRHIREDGVCVVELDTTSTSGRLGDIMKQARALVRDEAASRGVDPHEVLCDYFGCYEDNDGHDLREGMQVEAMIAGERRYFPGVVRSVNVDGTYDIAFDDKCVSHVGHQVHT